MINIQDLLDTVTNLKGIWKEKMLNFILDNETIRFKDNNLIRGQYFNESKDIVIYGAAIKSKDDLKEVVLHEIGHHLGLEHKDIKH